MLEARIGDDLIVSDDSWRTCLAPYLRKPAGRWTGAPAVDILDGPAIPVGWTSPSFDDSGWDARLSCCLRGSASTAAPHQPAHARCLTPPRSGSSTSVSCYP